MSLVKMSQFIKTNTHRKTWTRIWDGTPILSASADTANALGDTVKMWRRGRAQ